MKMAFISREGSNVTCFVHGKFKYASLLSYQEYYYSTVTDFARFLGLSTSSPFATDT